MIEVTVFNAGRTVKVWAYVKDPKTEKLVDPTSVAVTITDSSGTPKVTSGSMTKLSTGIYYYDYNIPAAGPTGNWTILVVETDGSGDGAFTSDDTGSFEVK